VICLGNVEAKALDHLCHPTQRARSCTVAISQLTEKHKDGRFCHLLAAKKKNFQSFTVICRKPHVASSICLRATIFQNPEGTLWTHCTYISISKHSQEFSLIFLTFIISPTELSSLHYIPACVYSHILTHNYCTYTYLKGVGK
jgi:hypothetical protein